MAEKTEKKSFWAKFRHKYRLSIYRDETYEEVLNLKLTKLNVVTLVGIGVVVFLLIVISIIAYTPVREMIPGYPDQNTVRNIRLNSFRLDSLEMEIAKRDAYFENLRRIIAGEEPQNFDQPGEISTETKGILTFQKPREDSVLRMMVEPVDQFGLSTIERKNIRTTPFNVLFFPPVKGMITNSFDGMKNHYGTDIVAGSNEVVKATLPGTVLMAGWTLETGYVIELQHEGNLVSVYKHNAEVLKRIGDRVKAGEPIAIVGNSGEFTTGPHLHFELWYNGTPLNPELYVNF